MIAKILEGADLERRPLDGNREAQFMCDYSLHAVASRPAKVGDHLVTTKFVNTSTRGFSAVGEPDVAVCLLPGTEVAFEDEVRRVMTGFLMIFSKRARTIAHKVARFRRVDTDDQFAHHDALEFPDGQTVLLTHLRAGQQATVLQLPASTASARGELSDRPAARVG
jgi:hypothetical protein